MREREREKRGKVRKRGVQEANGWSGLGWTRKERTNGAIDVFSWLNAVYVTQNLLRSVFCTHGSCHWQTLAARLLVSFFFRFLPVPFTIPMTKSIEEQDSLIKELQAELAEKHPAAPHQEVYSPIMSVSALFISSCV